MSNKLKYIITALMIVFLSACSVKETKPDDQIDNKQTISDCDELPNFLGKTFGDLYEYTIVIYREYNICANKVKTLKSL